MGKSFSNRPFKIFWLIVLPSLRPYLVATVGILLGVAWKVVLTAELFARNNGLGYLINLARQDFDTAKIFGLIVVIVCFVYVSDRLLS